MTRSITLVRPRARGNRLAVGAIVLLVLGLAASSCRAGRPTYESHLERLAPEGTASIQGMVVDAGSGEPISRARVSVLFRDAGIAQLTGEDGSFDILGIHFGASRCAIGDLSVSAHGYGVWELRGFLFFSRGSFDFNEIELGPEDRVDEEDPLPDNFSCDD